MKRTTMIILGVLLLIVPLALAQTPAPTATPTPPPDDVTPVEWFELAMTYGGLAIAVLSWLILFLFYGRGSDLLGWIDVLEKDVELQAQIESDFMKLSPRVKEWVRGLISAAMALRTVIPGRRPKQVIELLNRVTDGKPNTPIGGR